MSRFKNILFWVCKREVWLSGHVVTECLLADGPMKPAALRRLVLDAKGPLSKSLSMPDMDNRTKKRDRLLA